MSPTAQTPPTDRPLTAGDVLWMMHVIGPDDIYPAPDHATAVEWCAYVNGEVAPLMPSVLCAAVPAIWTGSTEDHAAELPKAVEGWSRPATSAASEVEGAEPWEPAAEAMCAEVIKRAEVTCRKATDELYEGLLCSVQDYLRENVMLNLSGELERAHGYERDARAALVEIAKAAGVDFVDSRDGVERHKERILAALASPPVSERERELEGALRMAANRMDRLALEVQFDTRLRAEAADWVAEARALTAQPAGEPTHG